MAEPLVLFVDDEAAMRQSVAQFLALSGIAAETLDNAPAALARLAADFPGILVSDVRMPGMDGMALLSEARARDPELPVLLVTGHGDVPLAVAAMRAGAYDFIEKPFAPDRLVDTIRRALEKRRLVIENRRLRRQVAGGPEIARRLIGTAPAIEALRRDILDLAATDVNVLIHGETGTGKELVARCLHDCGPRSTQAFVALNCGAIPDTMVESELFGHESGAFTGAQARRIGKFEHAAGGTVFLDEIESMPLAAQVKVLRTLQERTLERLGSNKVIAVDLRAIAATKTDLRALSDQGRFREDLYYRLGVVELRLPPLRERREDIPLLFEFFVGEAAARHGRTAPVPAPGLLDRLMAQDWPGNVRELRNAAERFALGLRNGPAQIAETVGPGLADRVAAFERQAIEQALRAAGGDIALAMATLDLPRRTLNEKMARYGLERTQYLRK